MSLLLFSSLIISLSTPVFAGEVEVKAPPQYSYDDETINNFRVRGKYGRYLIFIGRSKNKYRSSSDPGSPGSIDCTTYGYSTSCTTSGYRPPKYSSGGVQHRQFIYQLDCLDLTFNREGDKSSASGSLKGWMPISNDPVAETVANKYCPKIDSLKKVWKSGEEYFVIKNLESLPMSLKGRSNQFIISANKKSREGNYRGAISDLNKSIKINPMNGTTYLLRGSHKEKLKDYAGAIEDKKKYISLRPIYPWKYADLADLHNKIGDYQGAIDSYTKGIDLAKKTRHNSYELYNSRGNTKYKIRDYRGACNDWIKASELGFPINLQASMSCPRYKIPNSNL